MNKLWRRIQYWINHRQLQADLEEEMEFHRAMKREEFERAGMQPDESFVAASRSMGNLLNAREDARHVWVWPHVERFFQDVRYGFRMLRKSPALTAVAVLSLALGIGANSMVFSMVNALLFKPLPVENPGRLVWTYGTAARSSNLNSFSYPDYLDYRAQADTFEDLFAYNEMPVRVLADGKPAVLWGAAATENFFSGLGLKASIGRTFTAEDGNAPGAVPLAVISDGMWRRQFAGDPAVVGKPVTLNGRSFTVVGVLPAAFSGTRAFGFIPEVWIPLAMIDDSESALKNRNNDFLFIMGRLKPGVSIQQADATLRTIGERLNREYRTPTTAIAPHVITGSRKVNPYVEQSGILQLGSALTLVMVGFVLLIACANVANLILTRLASRHREVAVRLALGATGGRLTRQLLTESLLLSCIGGLFGLVLGMWLKNAMIPLTVPNLDFEVVEQTYMFSTDWRIIGFTLLITFLAAIVCGVAPAMQASRSDLSNAMKGVFKAGAGGRFRKGLVLAQVTLCIVLLVCAGLAIRSAVNARNIDPGFGTKDLLVMRVNLELQGYDQAHRRQFYRDVRQKLEGLPGAVQASIGFPLPLDAYDRSRTVVPEGFAPGPGTEQGYSVGYSVVAPGYFQTMRTPIIAGRAFQDSDSESVDRVVVVNQTMARRFWPDEDPIGKRIRLGLTQGPYATVIGVAHDGKYMTLGEAPQSYMFLAALQNFPDQATIVIRTKSDPASIAGPAREQIRQVDPTLAVLGVQTIDQFRARIIALPDMLAIMCSGFGILALTLAAIGLYGVISVTIGQRTQEIGIRIAIGARRADVVRMIIRQSGGLVVIGCVLGLAGALAIGSVMSNLLFGVTPSDPIALAAAFGIVVVIAAIATYLPARRAANSNPVQSLRCE
jgi:predicted permease